MKPPRKLTIVAVFTCLIACSLPADPSISSPREEGHQQPNEFRKRQAEAEYEKRAFPLKQIPSGAMAHALAQIQQTAGPKPRVSSYTWYNLGPAPMNSTAQNQFQPVSGRVSCLAVDPSNQQHWLIGAAQGGVWETVDAGA